MYFKKSRFRWRRFLSRRLVKQNPRERLKGKLQPHLHWWVRSHHKRDGSTLEQTSKNISIRKIREKTNWLNDKMYRLNNDCYGFQLFDSHQFISSSADVCVIFFHQHVEGVKNKLKTINNIISKLTGIRWMSRANVLSTSALALVYSQYTTQYVK